MSRAATPLRWLLCLGMALALLVPAAAWGAHSLRHALPTAAHASPAPAGERRPEAPDKQDGGHDHLLSQSVPVAALFDHTLIIHPPAPVAGPAPVAVARLALRAAEPPPDDPPRTA
jgi:hypothetical protein